MEIFQTEPRSLADSIKTHYAARASEPDRHTLHVMKFLPGVVAGVRSSLYDKYGDVYPLIFTSVLAIGQANACVLDYLTQINYDLEKIVEELKNLQLKEGTLQYTGEIMPQIQYTGEIMPQKEYVPQYPPRDKSQIIETTIGVSLIEAALGYVIGFYVTEFAKSMLNM